MFKDPLPLLGDLFVTFEMFGATLNIEQNLIRNLVLERGCVCFADGSKNKNTLNIEVFHFFTPKK